MDGATVYLLKCGDGSFYVGITRRDPAERTSEHNLGLHRTAWTYPRRPTTLVWSEHFARIDEAIAAERRIKGWSRAKKEALIRGDYAALSALAARKRKSRV